MDDKLKELFWHWITAALEPHAHFRPEHKRNVRMVRTVLEKPKGVVHPLSSSILQNSFLSGCMEFTRDEPVEHLIVGFGKRYGGGTNISRVLHIVGDKTSVRVPDGLIELIKKHASTGRSSQTILFHNHPNNWLNAILPGIPIPSAEDRLTMMPYKYFEPFFLVRTIFHEATMRFYVGERGKVREIRLPYLKDLWTLSQRMNM